MQRQCGECTLCCRLVPVADGMLVNGEQRPGYYFDKPAGVRCMHQRHKKGCAIYARRPFGCQAWSCVWLLDSVATAKMSRPDRCHYCIDPMKDVIDILDHDTGESIHMAVIQVWCDPRHRDAWRDPALIELIERMGEAGVAALVRYDNKEGFAVFPNSITGNGLKTISSDMSLPLRSVRETISLLQRIPRQ